ncbi:prenyltransferase alpha subunit repeat-containing 1 [Brachionus plicatilis]|uniref:Prenyltransferase alpha subunit repeat-containing 1 n=1 Tax=Brachionus plicatilis TaxID=10195 RepID=A0A3M7SKS5_BRAPC|nr:prenyltransferase alpha subunit repeat-containing 1 [Brachionus plicatilis]
MNVNECIEETNGRELIKLINEKIKTTDLNLKLCEFDILPIPDKSKDIDVITMCILLINPNFSSAWSKRKEIAIIDLFHELEFNRLILSKHFKCEQAFIHRRWLIKKITKTKGADFVNLVDQEINFLIDYLPKTKHEL